MSRRKSRMFSAVKRTWNPIVIHPCPHQCVYCWTRYVVRRYGLRLYLESGGKPILVEKRLRSRFSPGDFVFFCDMCDAFADEVPDEYLLRCFEAMKRFPSTTFLLLTKNPFRFVKLLERFGAQIFSPNMVFGTTIEALDDSLYSAYRISRALPPSLRLQWLGIFVDKMVEEAGWRPKTFISVEPILLYWVPTEIEVFADILARSIKPIYIYVGYDNYGITKKLRIPEPRLETTMRLIEELRKGGLRVIEKTLRRSWLEEDQERGSKRGARLLKSCF